MAGAGAQIGNTSWSSPGICLGHDAGTGVNEGDSCGVNFAVPGSLQTAQRADLFLGSISFDPASSVPRAPLCPQPQCRPQSRTCSL